jgi:hypothetical protein
MMGRQTADQARLFYEFHLDERVAAHHLVRRIEVFNTAALADLCQTLADLYSHTGRPSIDPELLIRMLILGYCWDTVGAAALRGVRGPANVSLVLPPGYSRQDR